MWSKLLTFVITGLGVSLLGCANISDFNSPYMQEVFTGSLDITPVLEGMHPGGASSTVVTVTGNKSRSEVAINGLPKNDPFAIVEKMDPLSYEPAPMVSGLIAEVVDKRTLKVTGFKRMNHAAEDLDLTVSGTLIREGPRLSTSPSDPIIIRGKLKPILDLFPDEIKHRVVRIKDKKPIEELDSSEVINLYQINFIGFVISVL